MTATPVDDTFDFSALDALSSSSTPRILRKQSGVTMRTIDQNNNAMTNAMTTKTIENDYSIHLSALGLPSASSTLEVERDLIQIRSDDIGGPSDFTLNMADWINGTRSKNVVPDSKVDASSHLSSKTAATARYEQPSMEDATTPLAHRSADVRTAIPVEPIETILGSSQCLPDFRAPCPSLETQFAALKARCDELQRSNDDLRRLLQNKSSTTREASLEVQLRQEQRLRAAEQAAAEAAQLTSDRELQRANERSQALQSKLSDERAASVQRQIDHELAQKELQAQTVTWMQKATEARSKTNESLSPVEAEPAAPDAAHVKKLETELASLKIDHADELRVLREEYEGVARDVDDFVVAKVKAREQQYATVDAKRQAEISRLRNRNKELERLYALCGKELMLTWGREECGTAPPGSKQKYRYQTRADVLS